MIHPLATLSLLPTSDKGTAMATHNDKVVKRLFKELMRLGFEISRTKNGVFKITPPKGVDGPIYTTHGTEKCIKPLKRDFRKMYGVDLDKV